MNQFRKENLIVRVFDTRIEMGEAAANAAAAAIHDTFQKKAQANVIFAAAPSQNEMLAALASQPIDWSRVNAFHMDEYVGLPVDAPQTFRHYLEQHIFRIVSVGRIYFIDGRARDAQAECERYSQLLREYPPDVVCMGIGENGHIAFNDPPADFEAKNMVKVVSLDHLSRQQQVNDGCFPSIDKVPRQALTLTIPVLMSAHHIICVVPGSRKATAVFNTLNHPVDRKYPSSILRIHPKAALFLDVESARETWP